MVRVAVVAPVVPVVEAVTGTAVAGYGATGRLPEVRANAEPPTSPTLVSI